MPYVEWDPSFLLGVQEFDEHHQHLVALLNRAYDDFKQGARLEDVDAILEELVDYTTYHFAAEERWMHKYGYPETEKHRAEHAKFSQKVTEMMRSEESDRMMILLEIMAFLNYWIVDHILQTDAEYGQFIHTHPIDQNASSQ